MGKLYAIADLHLGYKFNADALAALRDTHRDDGLILAGDLGERDEHLRLAFAWATERFKTVWWCPGNHELYSMPDYSSSSTSEDGGGEKKEPLRGQAKYDACVAVAREYGVLTPEDPFVTWEGEGEGGGDPAIVCPVFTLYDYSFAPEDVPKGKEVDWAAEKDICATDEALLHPDPYPTRQAWCEALVERFERKLEDTVTAAAAAAVANNRDEKTKITTEESSRTGTSEKEEEEATATETTTKPKPKLIIVNHWPLLERLVYLPAIPRFRIWCGTRRTADWAARFGAAVVVSGHLHIRRTDWVGGVRYGM